MPEYRDNVRGSTHDSSTVDVETDFERDDETRQLGAASPGDRVLPFRAGSTLGNFARPPTAVELDEMSYPSLVDTVRNVLASGLVREQREQERAILGLLFEPAIPTRLLDAPKSRQEPTRADMDATMFGINAAYRYGFPPKVPLLITSVCYVEPVSPRFKALGAPIAGIAAACLGDMTRNTR